MPSLRERPCRASLSRRRTRADRYRPRPCPAEDLRLQGAGAHGRGTSGGGGDLRARLAEPGLRVELSHELAGSYDLPVPLARAVLESVLVGAEAAALACFSARFSLRLLAGAFLFFPTSIT